MFLNAHLTMSSQLKKQQHLFIFYRMENALQLNKILTSSLATSEKADWNQKKKNLTPFSLNWGLHKYEIKESSFESS